mmetsp:Transcript_14142/g.45110  ORF Transcript_14142/g.45110 Transcript_14142/m.45110 type:complete len:195 (+) Transcript_14142:412-996(+)
MIDTEAAAGRRKTAVKAALFGGGGANTALAYQKAGAHSRPGGPGYRPGMRYREGSPEPLPPRPPSAPYSARGRPRLPLEVRADEAATKIQAGYRGLRARKEVQARRRNTRRASMAAGNRGPAPRASVGFLYDELGVEAVPSIALEDGWVRQKAEEGGRNTFGVPEAGQLRRTHSTNTYEILEVVAGKYALESAK